MFEWVKKLITNDSYLELMYSDGNKFLTMQTWVQCLNLQAYSHIHNSWHNGDEILSDWKLVFGHYKVF